MSLTKTRFVADRLRDDISNEVWLPGARLPKFSELAERFDVSVMTIREAVRQLALEGLLVTSTSQGTVVRSPEEAVDHVLTDQPDWLLRAWATVTARASAEGRSAEDEFTARMEPASAEVARWLGIKPKAWVVARATRRIVDGKPWSWEVSYYPREVAELVGLDAPTAIAEGDTQRLDASGHPEVAWKAVASSHPARPDEADALDVPIGRWITDVVRIGATRERIVRATRARFAADENQLVSEVGDEAGLRVIHSTLNSANGEPDAR